MQQVQRGARLPGELGRVLLLLVRLPLAAWGVLTHVATYFVVDRIARRPERTVDVVSTYKVFGALLLYPLTWLTVAACESSIWKAPLRSPPTLKAFARNTCSASNVGVNNCRTYACVKASIDSN